MIVAHSVLVVNYFHTQLKQAIECVMLQPLFTFSGKYYASAIFLKRNISVQFIYYICRPREKGDKSKLPIFLLGLPHQQKIDFFVGQKRDGSILSAIGH